MSINGGREKKLYICIADCDSKLKGHNAYAREYRWAGKRVRIDAEAQPGVLDEPFSEELVTGIAADKAPGPDGYIIGEFFKVRCMVSDQGGLDGCSELFLQQI